MSRQKGSTFERNIARDLRVVFGEEAKRGIGQTRSAREVADVDGTPFWLELKNKKALSLRKVIEQARAETDGRPPVLVVKHGRSEVVACLPWALFVRLLEALEGGAMVGIQDWPHLPIYQAGQIADAQEAGVPASPGAVGPDWEPVMLERQRSYVEGERRRRAKTAKRKKA
jgi:hypothetical protein